MLNKGAFDKNRCIHIGLLVLGQAQRPFFIVLLEFLQGIILFVVQIEYFHLTKAPFFFWFLRPWMMISSQFKETGNPAVEQPLKEATSHRK